MQKMGGETNSLRSDKFPLFFHFSHRITGWLQAEIPDWLAAHRLGHSPSAS
jgi:predicted DNA-binding transcriptional regulator AlpA